MGRLTLPYPTRPAGLVTTSLSLIRPRTVQKHGCLIGSVGCGCYTCQLPKLFTQMTMAVEPTQEGNVYNRLVCLFQQLPFLPVAEAGIGKGPFRSPA
jgi:hypothetical protein